MIYIGTNPAKLKDIYYLAYYALTEFQKQDDGILFYADCGILYADDYLSQRTLFWNGKAWRVKVDDALTEPPESLPTDIDDLRGNEYYI